MSKTSKILIAVMVLAVLLLGIGYAAIQNVTLNITGNAVADTNQANFKVQFSGTPTVSDATKVTAAVTDELNATINVIGLTKKGETASATYTVQNASEDLSADLAVATTNSNPEYFTITSELEKTSLVAGEATTVEVTVELTKNIIDAEKTATIGVQLTAMPVQPGEEGTSEGINGSSQSPEEASTLALVTNDNIGDYIDLGNNIIGEATTTDDWRVFYVDEETDTVYAILADYLPVSKLPEAADFYTKEEEYPYNVCRGVLTEIEDESIWSGFSNGIIEAVVTGSPSLELLLDSYNAKNGTELVYIEDEAYNFNGGDIQLDNATEDYNLYVPHTDGFGECDGYWLATSWTGVSQFAIGNNRKYLV